MEEATRGDPKIHTPSMVLVQPIERVRFQGRGQETGRPYVASVFMHVSVCVCVCVCVCVSTFMCSVQN